MSTSSIWNTAKGVPKAALYAHWPRPFNHITSLEVIACNQDGWMAKIKMAFPTLVTWLFTTFIPSPQEIERRAFFGNYKCGFFIEVPPNAKAELKGFRTRGLAEILGQPGLGEFLIWVARPVLTTAFFLWAMDVERDALQAWSTIMLPQELCDPPFGDAFVRDKTAPIGVGHVEGSVPGGEVVYDYHHQVEGGTTAFDHDAGPLTAYVSWVFETSSAAINNLSVGFLVDGVPTNMSPIGNVPPFSQVAAESSFSNLMPNAGAINCYFECDRPSGVGFPTVTCPAFVCDQSPWNPNLNKPILGPPMQRVPCEFWP